MSGLVYLPLGAVFLCVAIVFARQGKAAGAKAAAEPAGGADPQRAYRLAAFLLGFAGIVNLGLGAWLTLRGEG